MDLRRVLTRIPAVSASACLVVVALATPAFAHAELKSSNPAKGASVASAPKQIELTFSEAVSPRSVTVTGPQGASWTVGQIAVAGPVVTVPVTAIGPAGEYTVTYQVLSEDGDPVTGAVPFTLTTAATPAPTTTVPTTVPSPAPTTDASADPQPAPAAAEDSGGMPGWVWILIAVAILLVAGAIVGRRVRSRTDRDADSADR